MSRFEIRGGAKKKKSLGRKMKSKCKDKSLVKDAVEHEGTVDQFSYFPVKVV